MDPESLKTSISQYKEQLQQINIAISSSIDGSEKDDLINLKADIEQLIELTEENLETLLQNQQPSTSGGQNTLDDEYSLFMQEMEKEGAVDQTKSNTDVEDDLKSLEGMKCQAPHEHTWGDSIYHNAMVCGAVSTSEDKDFNEIQVRVMFTNPTHQEMLPCPYFLEGSCKFPEEKCKFSHGELVHLSQLREFKEPNFTRVKTGSKVLAKRSSKLWQRAVVKQNTNGECSIKFESSQQEHILPLHDVLPLDDTDSDSINSDSDSIGSDNEENVDCNNESLIQRSLLNSAPSQKLGDWEKHTKGIGSKLMEQMGYVIGTGLGRRSDGRLEPVEAIVLPAGKSLDHCMTLRENAGGDENLFSVERRLKKLQKKQEERNKRAYDRAKQKKDVFEFINDTLVLSKTKNQQKNAVKCKSKLKAETNRDLNVASMKIEEDIKKVEQELLSIRESLTRHNIPNTAMNKSLKTRLGNKQIELKRLHDFSKNVRSEQTIRKDQKKMTVF